MTYSRLLEPRMECLDLRYPKLKVADHYWVWRGAKCSKVGRYYSDALRRSVHCGKETCCEFSRRW